MKKFLLTLLIGLSLVLPTQSVSAAPPQCNLSGDQKVVRLNPAGISACLEEGAAGQRFEWIITTWKWSLSVVNIFAVMVLVFMAFANILYPWKTLEPYRIRQLLPNFIFGIILANLSLLIVKAVTSVADILMNTPELVPTARKIWEGWGIDMALLPFGVVQAVYGQQGLSYTAGGMIYQFLLSLILVYLPIIALLLLSIYFYVRFAVIFVLAALSPLAFGAIIFPATKGFLNQWWGYFAKWTFGGVVAYLIMFLAIQVKGSGDLPSTPGGIAGTPSLIDINNLGINLIPYAISLGLFFAALVAPFKLGNFMTAFVTSIPKRAVSMGWGATKFVGKQGTGKGWMWYGNLMGAANKYEYASRATNPDGSWKSPARELIEGRSKNKLLRNPLGRALGYAGVAAGYVSKYNLYNAVELFGTRAKGWERIRTEGSWQNRMTHKFAGAEEVLRYWLLQDKGFYDGKPIEDVDNDIRGMERRYGLPVGFFDELKKSDPENYRLLKGTAGERWKAANAVQINGKSLFQHFEDKANIEDFAKTTIAIRSNDANKDMLGRNKPKDEVASATDEAVMRARAALPDISATELQEAIEDALRTAANQVVLTPLPAGGIAAGAPAGLLANAIESRLNSGRPTPVTLDRRTIDYFNEYHSKVKNSIDKIHDDTKARIQHSAQVTTSPTDQKAYKDMAMKAWYLVTSEHLGGGATANDLSNLVTGQQSLVDQLKEMDVKLSAAKNDEEKAQIVNNTFATSITAGIREKATKDNVGATIEELKKSAHVLEHYFKQELTNPAPAAGNHRDQLLRDLRP